LQRRRKSKFTDDPGALREPEARGSELENDALSLLENMDENERLRGIVEPHGGKSANETTGPGTMQPEVSRKAGKIAELPGLNVMSVKLSLFL
jgi:hypothetical protein